MLREICLKIQIHLLLIALFVSLGASSLFACSNSTADLSSVIYQSMRDFQNNPVSGYRPSCCSSNVIRLVRSWQESSGLAIDYSKVRMLVVLDQIDMKNGKQEGNVVLHNQVLGQNSNYIHHSFLVYKGKVIDPDFLGRALPGITEYLEKQFGWKEVAGRLQNISGTNLNAKLRIFSLDYILENIITGNNDKNTEYLIDEIQRSNPNSPDYSWQEALQVLRKI